MDERAVERLADKYNIPADRARAALTLACEDILDAAQLLERESPELERQVAFYTTQPRPQARLQAAPAPGPNVWERFWTVLRGLFLHPVANRLEVTYPAGGRVDIPAVIALLLLFVTSGAVVILLVLGWVWGYRFALRGPEVDLPGVNRVLDAACDQMARWRKGCGR